MNAVTPFPTPEAQVLRASLENISDQVCNVMGVVSLIEAAAPGDVLIGDPDFKRAARAISLRLDEILSQITALAEACER